FVKNETCSCLPKGVDQFNLQTAMIRLFRSHRESHLYFRRRRNYPFGLRVIKWIFIFKQQGIVFQFYGCPKWTIYILMLEYLYPILCEIIVYIAFNCPRNGYRYF